MLIYWNKRKHLHERRVQQHGRRFIVSEHQMAAVTSFENHNRVFSIDVTAAILVSQDNETAAILVSQTNLVGVELFSYANAFFCPNKFA